MDEPTFSVSQIARAMGAARETVSRKLAAAGAEPAGQRGGYPVYDLPAIVAAFAAHGGKRDPSQMNAFELRAFYAAERDRLKLGIEAGDLLVRADVAAVLGRIAGPLVRELETLPDRLERDMRVSGEVVEYVRGVIRAARDRMAAAIDEVGKA